MKIWNLTEFSDLEECVLTPYDEIEQGDGYKFRHGNPRLGFARMFVATAALAIYSISGIELNSSTFQSPTTPVHFAQTGTEQGPPLGEMFSSRFDDEWTEHRENRLLEIVESKRKELAMAELKEQAVDSIFYNQQEGVSGRAMRLPREVVERIVKERKLV